MKVNLASCLDEKLNNTSAPHSWHAEASEADQCTVYFCFHYVLFLIFTHIDIKLVYYL